MAFGTRAKFDASYGISLKQKSALRSSGCLDSYPLQTYSRKRLECFAFRSTDCATNAGGSLTARCCHHYQPAMLQFLSVLKKIKKINSNKIGVLVWFDRCFGVFLPLNYLIPWTGFGT